MVVKAVGKSNDDFTVREMLIEMRGTLDLIQADNTRTNDAMKELKESHKTFETWRASVEAAKNFQLGEKKGFDKAVRAVYALATVCGLGGIAAAAKILIPAIGGH